MKHKEVGPLQHGERKERKREGRMRKLKLYNNRRERKQYETTRMNNEH
jgi:hypothetical protein